MRHGMFKHIKPGEWIRTGGTDYLVTRVTHDRGWVVVETSGMFTLREHGDTGLFVYHDAPWHARKS